MERELEVAASKLLKRAAQAGVFLSYSQERLHFKLTVEIFPQALKNEIVANKAALIALLKYREPDRNDALRPSRVVPHGRATNELPLSFAQQRLWFIDQLDGAARSTTCLVVCAYGGASVRRLRSAPCAASSSVTNRCAPFSATVKRAPYNTFGRVSISNYNGLT